MRGQVQVTPAVVIPLWVSRPDDIGDSKRLKESFIGVSQFVHAGSFIDDP
ncbi:hypothetical protein SDC9_188152 [bioreactor metagenome]|uniref:Uncharacterized protein n=1 Tax=bioreactor metagenome TaxID=1076179 RepID=A0A645HWP8_9ZZZZ